MNVNYFNKGWNVFFFLLPRLFGIECTKVCLDCCNLVVNIQVRDLTVTPM